MITIRLTAAEHRLILDALDSPSVTNPVIAALYEKILKAAPQS